MFSILRKNILIQNVSKSLGCWLVVIDDCMMKYINITELKKKKKNVYMVNKMIFCHGIWFYIRWNIFRNQNHFHKIDLNGRCTVKWILYVLNVENNKYFEIKLVVSPHEYYSKIIIIIYNKHALNENSKVRTTKIHFQNKPFCRIYYQNHFV